MVVEILIGISIVLIAGLTTWASKKLYERIWTSKLSLDTKINTTSDQGYLTIRVRNTGKKETQGTVYWHIFIDHRIKLISSSHNHEQRAHKIGDKHYLHFRDAIKDPVYPDSQYGCIELSLQLPEIEEITIRGYLSTVNGNIPKSLRKTNGENISLEEVPKIAIITSRGIEKLEFTP